MLQKWQDETLRARRPGETGKPPSQLHDEQAVKHTAGCRELLRDLGTNYLDLTGNVDLRLTSPVATLRLAGSDRDPKPGHAPHHRTGRV